MNCCYFVVLPLAPCYCFWLFVEIFYRHCFIANFVVAISSLLLSYSCTQFTKLISIGVICLNLIGKQRNATTIAVRECSEGFYRENGSSICIPSCHTWLQHNRGLSIFLDVVIFIFIFIGFLTSAVVIVLSYFVRKRM